MFEFNKERAKSVLQSHIRNVRNDIFKELDVAYMRAIENGDTQLQSEIATKKQSLRDATNINTGSFETREELLSLWPEDLLGKNPYI